MGIYLIGIIKIALAIILLPLVIACSMTLQGHIESLPNTYQGFFIWGMVAFLFVFLFLYQFWGFYEFGQKITQGLFRFLAPIEKYFAYMLPFYLIATLILFYIIKIFFKTDMYDPNFMFFTGFTFLLHIILSAQDLQQQETSSFKWAYLFVMCLVFIINVCILVLMLDLIIGEFTFPQFLKTMISGASDLYIKIFTNPLFIINQ